MSPTTDHFHVFRFVNCIWNATVSWSQKWRKWAVISSKYRLHEYFSASESRYNWIRMLVTPCSQIWCQKDKQHYRTSTWHFFKTYLYPKTPGWLLTTCSSEYPKLSDKDVKYLMPIHITYFCESGLSVLVALLSAETCWMCNQNKGLNFITSPSLPVSGNCTTTLSILWNDSGK